MKKERWNLKEADNFTKYRQLQLECEPRKFPPNENEPLLYSFEVFPTASRRFAIYFKIICCFKGQYDCTPNRKKRNKERLLWSY